MIYDVLTVLACALLGGAMAKFHLLVDEEQDR